ncbi:3-isopropylmalate dehydrogenase [Nanoarchaeota archaeon]
MGEFKIAVLPGDGIGREIMPEAIKVLDKIAEKYNHKFNYTEADVGGVAIDKHGEALPKATIDICKDSDAILFGCVGGPKWDELPPEQRPERGALLPLRKMFDLYANLRPAKLFPSLKFGCPLNEKAIGDGFDIMVVRELTSGIYFGKKDWATEWASDEMKYHVSEIKRIAKSAFEIAMKRSKKLTSIDKANVLQSMILWRKMVDEVAKEYPDVEFSNLYVDNAAQQLVRQPGQFDVMLCPNMFGDILSDEAAVITGSLGMLPSASLNKDNFGLYEPAGGSAPDIAGKGIANPIAQILSAAMMLKYSFNLNKEASAIDAAVEKAVEKYRTGDIMQEGMTRVNTAEMGDKIVENL